MAASLEWQDRSVIRQILEDYDYQLLTEFVKTGMFTKTEDLTEKEKTETVQIVIDYVKHFFGVDIHESAKKATAKAIIVKKPAAKKPVKNRAKRKTITKKRGV